MVFLIQRSPSEDAVALHLKLNQIVAALQGASDHLINVEDLTRCCVVTTAGWRRVRARAARSPTRTRSSRLARRLLACTIVAQGVD